jgi:hypothetical protein
VHLRIQKKSQSPLGALVRQRIAVERVAPPPILQSVILKHFGDLARLFSVAHFGRFIFCVTEPIRRWRLLITKGELAPTVVACRFK